MFCGLKDFQDQKYWEEHPYIYLAVDSLVRKYAIYTAYEVRTWEITYGTSDKYEEGIVLPIQKYHQKYKLLNKQNELALKLKRNPTTKELANYLEVSEKHLIKFLEILELVDYRYLTQEIDYGHEDMPNLTLEETVADKDANFEEKVLYKGVLKEILEQIDTILTPNEKDILFKRNGYNVPNEQTLTLSEIAKKKNISAEAVRKIEQKALRKLKCYKVKRYNPFN